MTSPTSSRFRPPTSTSCASVASRTCGKYSTAMASPEELLDQFAAQWQAGERPSVEEFLQRVPTDQREQLNGLLNAFLDQASTPAFSPETLAAIQREPVGAELGALAESRSGFWPS